MPPPQRAPPPTAHLTSGRPATRRARPRSRTGRAHAAGLFAEDGLEDPAVRATFLVRCCVLQPLGRTLLPKLAPPPLVASIRHRAQFNGRRNLGARRPRRRKEVERFEELRTVQPPATQQEEAKD